MIYVNQLFEARRGDWGECHWPNHSGWMTLGLFDTGVMTGDLTIRGTVARGRDR